MTSPAPGLPLAIPFAIPAYWTPEQALAVIEILDDLRERILAHYQLQLADLYREQQGTRIPEKDSASDDDPVF